MTADQARRGPDRPFVQVGIGMARTWHCMGCHQSRQPLGSRGVGVLKRCSFCVAKKAARTISPSRLSAPETAGIPCGGALSAVADR